jgi:hypothetical protein
MHYMMQANNIILAVHPANQDLANSDALKLALEADPEGTLNCVIAPFTAPTPSKLRNCTLARLAASSLCRRAHNWCAHED